MKKTLYVDMDNVLVDFQTGIDRLDPRVRLEYEVRLDEVPGILCLMDPVPGALEWLEGRTSNQGRYHPLPNLVAGFRRGIP